MVGWVEGVAPGALELLKVEVEQQAVAVEPQGLEQVEGSGLVA